MQPELEQHNLICPQSLMGTGFQLVVDDLQQLNLTEESADYGCVSQKDDFRRPFTNAYDFCSPGIFVKAYACHSFVYLKGTSMKCQSAQEWIACTDCASLNDAQQWHALTRRAVGALAKQYGFLCSEVPLFREQIDQLHGAFRRHIIAES